MNGRGQNSRIYWALARDNAVPFSSFFSKVSERLSCPVPATVFVGKSLHVFLTTILYVPRPYAKDILLTDQRTELTKKTAVVATGLGAIPIGSSTAFLDLTGSFIILTTVSYAIPFLGNVLTRRRHFPKGPFHLGKWGDAVNITAVVLITFFNVFYCFREYLFFLSFSSCLMSLCCIMLQYQHTSAQPELENPNIYNINLCS